jgi:hypothetical protein
MEEWRAARAEKQSRFTELVCHVSIMAHGTVYSMNSKRGCMRERAQNYMEQMVATISYS